jgi:hypothetical protein
MGQLLMALVQKRGLMKNPFELIVKKLVASNFSEVSHGVQFVSTLIKLPKFKMVWGIVPDYMHCVLLGILRRFLNI